MFAVYKRLHVFVGLKPSTFVQQFTDLPEFKFVFLFHELKVPSLMDKIHFAYTRPLKVAVTFHPKQRWQLRHSVLDTLQNRHEDQFLLHREKDT